MATAAQLTAELHDAGVPTRPGNLVSYTESLALRAGAWHLQPHAKRAIQACVDADERPTVQFDTYVQTRDEYLIPGINLGKRVEAIREAFGKAALEHGDATGDYTLFSEWCAAPDAAQAILAAFSRRRELDPRGIRIFNGENR